MDDYLAGLHRKAKARAELRRSSESRAVTKDKLLDEDIANHGMMYRVRLVEGAFVRTTITLHLFYRTSNMMSSVCGNPFHKRYGGTKEEAWVACLAALYTEEPEVKE